MVKVILWPDDAYRNYLKKVVVKKLEKIPPTWKKLYYMKENNRQKLLFFMNIGVLVWRHKIKNEYKVYERINNNKNILRNSDLMGCSIST